MDGVTRTPPDTALFRSDIRARIQAALGPDLDQALLYGSRARGDAKPDSDWDVLVLLKDHGDLSSARRKMRDLTGALAEETNECVSIIALRWLDADSYVGLLANVAQEGQAL